ncbi:MAG TPA: glycosyltransferase [Burkholderiales bacterium]
MSDTRCAIMALAPQDWGAQWVNRQQLLSRIGRHHTVLYSTGGWFMWDRISDAWRRTPFFGRVIPADNVWVDESPRWLMRWPRFPVVDRAVMRLEARRWRQWLKARGHSQLIAHICHPAFGPYLDLLKPRHVVYHVYDQYDLMPGWSSALEESERRLLRRSDLVFCASEMMARALQEKVPRRIEVLPNAADVGAFFRAARTMQEPPDLAAVPHPRIGWTGSLHPQIDFGLIAALARRRPDWHFVFVGNKVNYSEARAEQEYQECLQLRNVHMLGYKHHDEVPPYVLGMDVNMMCYRLSDETWIKANSPLKLYEYLAAGRPVVAANLPSVQHLSNVVKIADGVEDWEESIEEALLKGGRGTPDQRRAIAAENSWDQRAETLNAWLTQLAGRRPRLTPVSE